MSIYRLGAKGGPERIDVPVNHAKNSLPVGTVLRWGGNMGSSPADFVVVAATLPDRQFSGYGARYDLVNLEDGSPETVEALSISTAEEGGRSGQRFTITDRVLGADEVAAAVAKRADKLAADEVAKATEAKRKSDERARILREYPHLEAVKPGGYPSAKLAAANIRRELKRAFPGVKFSVRSETYSGGDSVRVAWTDGPTGKAVAAITQKYREGHFDGMTDSYENDDSAVWPDVFGGAKYVSESREVSREYVHEAAAIVLGLFAFQFAAGPEWPVGAEGVDLLAQFKEPTGGSFWNLGDVGRALAGTADLTGGIARLDDDGGRYGRGFFDYRLVGRAEVAAVDATRAAQRSEEADGRRK